MCYFSWETNAAKTIREMRSNSLDFSPLVVGVVGVPGSGKTTSSFILAQMLGKDCVVLPMDGYHYPISELKKFSNPSDAIYRRGAPDTFDSKKLQIDLERIKYGEEDTVSISGFDHAAGDPEANKHCFIRNQHRIVICEGLYLLHNNNGWQDISVVLDHVIYISANVDACIARLKERNKCIPGYSPEEMDIRCDAVDRINAETVERSKKRAHVIVRSEASL